MTLASLLDRLCERQSLTQAEARAAMDEIMDGRVPPAQIAGFLVALRGKGETAEEIAGMAASMRAHAARVASSRPNLVDTCGTGGDGKGTFNISTLAAIVAVGAGASVAKHGNRALSGKFGSADLLEALGVKIDLPADKVGRCIDEVGIGFMFAPLMHSAMKHAMGPRKELGVRTVFNILGPLTNPAGARRQLIGVFSPHLVELLARVLDLLGSESVMVVHGDDHTDEITLTTSTDAAACREGKTTRFRIDPEALGLARCRPAAAVAGGAAESLAIARAVLHHQPGPQTDVVLLNAAAALAVAGVAADLAEGLLRARESLAAGRALAALNLWIEVSNRL